MSASSTASTAAASWQPAEWSDERRMGFLMQPVFMEDAEAAETKLTFWQDTCFAYLRHRTQSGSSLSSSSSAASSSSSVAVAPPPAPVASAAPAPLTFTLAEVSKALSRRGESPAALELVLCRMLQSDTIRRVDRWNASAASSSSSTRSSPVARVGAYLWSWVSPSKKPLQRLPAGRYALVSAVAAEAAHFASVLAKQDTDVFTLEQLVALSGHRTVADVLLLAEQLRLDGTHPLVEALPSAAEQQPPGTHAVRVFRFGVSEATAADHTRGVLSATLRSLRSRADAKEIAARACEAEARRLLLQKRRHLALGQLQMKQRCVKALDGLHAQMDNIDALLTALEQADSQKQFLHCITAANQALKPAQTEVTADRVADVTEELAEQLDSVHVTEQALAQPSQSHTSRHGTSTRTQATVAGGPVVDVDAEYDALLAELAQEETAAVVAAPAATAAAAASSGGEAQTEKKQTQQQESAVSPERAPKPAVVDVSSPSRKLVFS